jgi:hypothetical protein
VLGEQVLGKPMDAANTPLVISDSRKEIEILATVGTDKITVKDLATGINDVIRETIKVYPVPAKEHITMVIPEGMFSDRSVRIKIMDFSGRYVYINNEYDLSGNPVTIDISTLSEGMYLLEVTDKTLNRRVKIVKMR